MDPTIRGRLEKIKDDLHNSIERDNATLKFVILAIGEVDRPIPPDPDDISPLESEESWKEEERKRTKDELSTHYQPPLPEKPPQTSQEKQQARISRKDPYKSLTLKTSIMVVLKQGPLTSKTVTEKLLKGGWQTDSKDPLLSVRACLSRMRHEIKHQKVQGILCYSLLPLEDLM